MASCSKTRWMPQAFISHEAMCRDFPIIPSTAKGIIGSVLKFAGYIHHSLQKLAWNYLWAHFEKRDGHHGCIFHDPDFKSAYICLIIGYRGLACEASLWAIMSWESFNVVRFGLVSLIQSHTRVAKLKKCLQLAHYWSYSSGM